MNKSRRGDYGAVPKNAPKSAKSSQPAGPTIRHSYAANPSTPKTNYTTTVSSSPDKNNVDGTGEGVVKYSSKVSKK